MEILVLNWRDPHHPLAGGAEFSLWNHSLYWKKKGANVTWFVSAYTGSKSKEEREGIHIIRKGSHFSVHFHAWRYMAKKKILYPDIVIDCFHFIPFFTPLYIRKAKIIALINEVAGKIWFANLFFPFAAIGFLLEPYFFAFYRKIPFIVGSESCKEDLVRVGISLGNISVIHHGVDIEKVSTKIKKEKNPTMLFLARISKDKGIKAGIEAYIYAKQHIPSLIFWIVGKEEKKGLLQDMIKGMEKVYAKDIHYFGFVSKKEKFILLKKAWILIHPSIKEGWGLTVIEAGSQSTPTIGYNVAGLKDSIRNNKTGILVPSDPVHMGKEIVSLIQKKRLYTLGRAAKKWAGEFSWEKSGEKSWQCIKEVYEKK